MAAPKRTQPPGGLRKGVPNKVPAAVKDMILRALDGVGGVEYLERQAEKNPAAFMALLGKVLPLQVSGDDGGTPLVIKIIRYADAANGDPDPGMAGVLD